MQAGFTPLLQASQDGKLGIVKLLVEYDEEMDIDQQTEVTQTTCLSTVLYALFCITERLVSYNAGHEERP